MYSSQGKFSPIDQIWQREKCKYFKLSYISEVLYENESTDKGLQIRELITNKEKRISPDGNCLFRSLSYVITGSDHNHKILEEFWLRI